MGWVSGTATFFIMWWLVIFCVLPLGLPTQYEEQGPYVAPGAPSKLNIKRKLLLTTFITAILWLILYGLLYFGILNFYDFVK